MTAPPMTPDEIARGLSPAQRRAILDCDKARGKWWIPFGRGVGADLFEKGVVDANLVWYWLNERGLAIREALKGME